MSDLRSNVTNNLDIKSVVSAFNSEFTSGDVKFNTAINNGGEYIKLATESSDGHAVMVKDLPSNVNANFRNLNDQLTNVNNVISSSVADKTQNRSTSAALKLAAESVGACLNGREVVNAYSKNLKSSLSNGGVDIIQSTSGNDGLNAISKIYMDSDNPTVSTVAMNTFDPLTMRPAMESFDGQPIHNHMLFNYALNALSIGTDPVLAAAYPVTPIAATASNIRYEFLYTTIIDQYEHDIKGGYNKSAYHKQPELLNIYNDKFWNNNFLKVIPRLVEDSAVGVNDGNTDLFIKKLSYTRTDGAEPVVTAPIALPKAGFNKTFGLLGTSQTEAQLSGKGQFDRTDALSSQINVRSIYFKLSDTPDLDEDADTNAEYFEIEIDGIYQHNFMPAISDGNSFKEVSLNTTEQVVYFRTNIQQLEQNKKEKANTKLLAASKNKVYTIGLPITMAGKITLDDGVINNFSINRNIDKLAVYDENDELLPKDQITDIIELFRDKFRFVGYEINAIRTNSNIRYGGRTLSLDKTSATFAVGFKSGNEFILPPDDSLGDENDTELVLSGRVSSTATFINNIGMVQFLSDVEKIKKLTESGIGRIKDKGVRSMGTNQFSIALKGIKPYFKSESFDIKSNLTATVDVDRIPNIQANILNKIGLLAAQMAIESNYLVAWRNNFGGTRQGNPTLYIACHEYLARILTVGKQEGEFIPDVNGYSINAKIVSTLDPRMENNIYMFFSDPNRGEGDGMFDPLSFGFCPMAPIVTHNFQRTENGRIVKHIQTQMRFENFVCCPIVTVMPITGFEEAFGPISTPVHGGNFYIDNYTDANGVTTSRKVNYFATRSVTPDITIDATAPGVDSTTGDDVDNPGVIIP
jgi:hypothetical protein